MELNVSPDMVSLYELPTYISIVADFVLAVELPPALKTFNGKHIILQSKISLIYRNAAEESEMICEKLFLN